jgi:hypothetical protein
LPGRGPQRDQVRVVLDRLEATVASLRTGLTDPAIPPVEAALQILDRELSGMTSWLTGQDDPAQAAQAISRFGDLIRATPSLRAYQADMMDQFAAVATQILAARAGVSADDPEPQIAARALLGLWHVQAHSLRTHLNGAYTPARLHELVASDVRRAARLIDTGLRSFPAPAAPAGSACHDGTAASRATQKLDFHSPAVRALPWEAITGSPRAHRGPSYRVRRGGKPFRGICPDGQW